MGSDIVLAAGVRQNLLSLQDTAALSRTTEGRLATGKKVNTALDNPINFFTASGLTARAGDLNALLDQIGLANHTLEQASTGISELTKLVQQAKSIAQQARSSTLGTYGAFNKVGTYSSGPEISSTVTAAQSLVASTAAGSFTVHVQVDGVGASDVTVSIGNGDDVNKIVDDINSAIFADGTAKGHLSAANLGGTLQIVNTDVNTHVTINPNATSAKLGVTANSTTNLVSDSKNLINNATSSIAQGQTLDLTVNGTATHITFGTLAGQVHDLAGLRSALGQVAGLDSGSDVISGLVKLNVAAKSTATSLSIAGTPNVLGVLGLTAGATPGVQGIDATRQNMASQFNDLLKQVDQLAGDASYNGINLLAGDQLKVSFNERNTSSITIHGVTFDAAGLGLSNVDGLTVNAGFQNNASVDGTIDQINAALSTLRSQAAAFGSNVSVVQTRQDFTKNLINTLKSGADDLTLADVNEEGANLLALQTRNQLGTTSLSLANQANQAVLRLFG